MDGWRRVQEMTVLLFVLATFISGAAVAICVYFRFRDRSPLDITPPRHEPTDEPVRDTNPFSPDFGKYLRPTRREFDALTRRVEVLEARYAAQEKMR
jgi:hypothetical protein